MAIQPSLSRHRHRERHAEMKGNAPLFRKDRHGPDFFERGAEIVEDFPDRRGLPVKVTVERYKLPARVRLIAVRERPRAFWTSPEFRMGASGFQLDVT
jgi:hypothetical protein